MTTSRRDFLATGALAAIAATLRPGSAFAALAQAPAPALPNVFTPIRRNVGHFTMRGGTVGWLVNPGGVAVVDSQFPTEAQALIEGLKTRSDGRAVDYLINTHHHGDHTGGNIAFRGVAKTVVSHKKAEEHMRQPPGGQPPADQLYPNIMFTGTWTADVGDEKIRARHYGRAHTSGDAVITFERANVAHMGDLMFHQRHPVVDRAAGATMRNWMSVLDQTAQDHDNDTVYIFGHANTNLPVTGGRADLAKFRDYLGAVLDFAEKQHKAGRTREEILAMRDPLPGFESYGRFGNPGARDPLTVAYEEVTQGA
jgi:glyoxylase-like metal-dependent hydrolase (beta-lactamase superfamily II)